MLLIFFKYGCELDSNSWPFTPEVAIPLLGGEVLPFEGAMGKMD